MKTLKELLPSVNAQFAAVEIAELTLDSRAACKGSLFLAIKGQKQDARDWIKSAIAAGASAVLAEKGEAWQVDAYIDGVPVIVVEGLAQEVGRIAARFYGNPSSQLRVCAVTGTNGKTSTSHLLAASLTALEHKSAILGTLGNGVYGALTESTHTTLDAGNLQAQFAQFVQAGAEFACIEASSHGLQQGRLNGTQIEVALFTNLTRDHLDYHGTMESYAAAKEILFRWPSLKSAVLNADDPITAQFKAALSSSVKCWQYSVKADSGADVVAKKVTLSLQGIQLLVKTPMGECDIKVPLLGQFNVSNLLAVIAGLMALNVSLADIVKALQTVKPVRGRMECFMGNHPTVVVDYAHTPDALEKVLTNLREHAEGQLICVFGCGGDRDKGKRPVMGRIAYQLADKTIITSDNPRTEVATEILADVRAGIPAEALVQVEEDRHAAIAQAIKNAQRQDIVLVAGKGHEDYQEINGVRHHFDDAEEVRTALVQWRAV